jgi:hypothetical protein
MLELYMPFKDGDEGEKSADDKKGAKGENAADVVRFH